VKMASQLSIPTAGSANLDWNARLDCRVMTLLIRPSLLYAGMRYVKGVRVPISMIPCKGTREPDFHAASVFGFQFRKSSAREGVVVASSYTAGQLASFRTTDELTF